MKNYRLEALLLAVGLIIAGFFIYLGFADVASASRDRHVSVRGLAEREVQADHVIWPLVYKTSGNDMQALYTQIRTVNGQIISFLQKNGIAAKDITAGAPQMQDLYADRYASSDVKKRDRYNVTSIITVSSGDVERVRNLIPRVGELLQQGIVISANEYGTEVQYEFRSLNKVKPAMIEEATRNAREAADKFAKDSESKLGKIKTAQQGLFSIENRDQYTPHVKTVRVVTSIDYYLES